MENRYRRKKDEGNIVSKLERMLPFRERLLSRLSFKRLRSNIRRWIVKALAAAAALVGLFYLLCYVLDQAASMSIDKIDYRSAHAMFDRRSCLDLLGLKNSVNLATLSTKSLEQKLMAQPHIESASVRAELPDTLVIEVEERLPIVFVAQESDVKTGTKRRLFTDPKGHVFEADPNMHRDFMGAPVWHLPPGCCPRLEPGVVINEKAMMPICELIKATNCYDPTQIPPIREIQCPHEWELRLVLENGTTVRMEVYNIAEQTERLAGILDYLRRSGQQASGINVIPKENPVIVPIEDTPVHSEATSADESRGSERSTRNGRSERNGRTGRTGRRSR